MSTKGSVHPDRLPCIGKCTSTQNINFSSNTNHSITLNVCCFVVKGVDQPCGRGLHRLRAAGEGGRAPRHPQRVRLLPHAPRQPRRVREIILYSAYRIL